MSSPIDQLRRRETGARCGADDRERIQAVAAFLLRRPDRCRSFDALRLFVGRRLTLHARLDQARFELAQEDRVFRERLRELSREAAAARSRLGEPAQPIRTPLDRSIGPGRDHRYFFAGGSSPVATRQMLDAARRAAIVAAAASAAYSPLHINFRSIVCSLCRLCDLKELTTFRAIR
jgi:hypothetical protein